MVEFLRKLIVFVRPYRVRLALGIGAGVVYALSNGALMVVVKLVCDAIFPTEGAPTLKDQLARLPWFLGEYASRWLGDVSIERHSTGLKLVIALVPLVMLVRGVFTYLSIYLMNWVAMRTIHDMRHKLFCHLQDLSAGFFHSARTGELMSRISNDTVVLYTIVAQSFATMVKDPITIIVLVALLISRQPWLTLIALVVFPLCISPVAYYGRKAREAAEAAQTHTAELNDVMQETLTGYRVVKAYGLERMVGEKFRDASRRYVSQMMRSVRAIEIPGPLIEFLGAIGVALVFGYMAYWSQRWSNVRMSSGDFFQFIGTIFMLYQPAKAISRLYGQLEQGHAASARVFELLETKPGIVDPPDPVPLRAANADIEFRDVHFAYGTEPVLKGIDLTVKAGQVVALVGVSGSGKSTLANLILRFYDPQRGAVLIGGTDIRRVTTQDLRSQIAVVTQETILFNDTVERNIELGRPGATKADIVEAAEHAHAHQFIMERPEGYQTVIGEKGVTLSGGQRQRIAIARAILRNAPVLILDEATSALDTESERAVQAALEELMKNRTTICIAHRLSTVKRADLIAVIDGGRIVEQGAHVDLLQRSGVYKHLYDLQFNV